MSDAPRPNEEHDETPKDDLLEYFGADGKDEGQKYYESGEASEFDDQTIAPPG